MAPTSRASDAIYLDGLRRNDPHALRALIGAYTRELSAIAVGVTGSRALGEEVLQDVFLSVWERRATLTRVENLGGYLHTLTRHRALDVLRHEQSQAARAGQVGLGAEMAAQNTGSIAIESADLRDAVLTALVSVPPRCREIFLLQWEGGLSAPEIAERLGVGTPTVYNQLSRAVKVLAEYFQTWPR